jgi:hypothetical protein
MDVVTHTVFYEKLRYIFVELPKFKKSVDELETNEDGWLYSLRNMEILDDLVFKFTNSLGKPTFSRKALNSSALHSLWTMCKKQFVQN